MLKVPGKGPLNPKIMIVGEAPGLIEELAGAPFLGESGKELTKMLREAGIDRDECYITNVCKYRPPSNELSAWMTDKKTIGPKNGWKQLGRFWFHPLIVEGMVELQQEIAIINPQCIVGFGNLALFACTNEWGITNWRGSEMHDMGSNKPFIPTLHPAAILRNWGARPLVIQDLKMRVTRRLNEGFIAPDFDFNTAPTCDEVCEYLYGLRGPIAGDIETSEGKIVCLGIAHSPIEAMCIPFIGPQGVWWTQEEYLRVREAIRYASTTNRIEWVGQNWNYDAQYFQEDLAIHAMANFDTYIAQSVLYPGSERGLGFLSSIYCDWHSYWKEDGKDWSKGIKDFHKEFRYNCRDVCATWEVAAKQKPVLEQAGLMPQFKERMKYSYSVYTMMRNGVNRDPARTEAIINEIDEAVQTRNILVAKKVGHPVNFQSPKQVAQLFYKELGCTPLTKRGTGRISTDDETLKKLIEKTPAVADIANAILESRSLSTIKANFLMAELDPDGKMRSSWMATGTETFRLTSSKNAFHRGGPLQNVTDGKHTHSGRPLPNLRSTIVPTMGCTIFNCDLERADLQVVAWEADDAQLKDVLRKHGDIHLVNAVMVFDIKGVPYNECFPEHPRYEEHKEKYEQKRHFGKTFCHLTNYGGGGRTCAIKVHTTVHQADLLQKRWFEIHPGIKRWHQRTSAQLMGTRTIYNKFGYRRVYLDRLDGLLPEALAWLPQSTVAILVSLQQMAIEEALPDYVSMIMQGHDSLIGQYRTEHESIILPQMHKASHIAVPYDDPLYIPLELATSTSSWGEVKKREWPL